jgi:protein TonB
VTQPIGYAGYLHNPPPAYPANAQRMGMEGKVILRVKVLASGKPASVEIQTSSGKKMLDEAAVAAVQGWMFTPSHRGQTPIDGWATVPIEFKLERS